MNFTKIFQWGSLLFAIIAGGNALIGNVIEGPYKDVIPQDILTYIMGATTAINAYLPRFAKLITALQVNSNEIEIKK